MKIDPVQLLTDNGFEIIQFCKQDDELFFSAELRFKGDTYECIRANQIFLNSGIEIFRCGLDLNIINGVLEKPCGSITFFRNEAFGN